MCLRVDLHVGSLALVYSNSDDESDRVHMDLSDTPYEYGGTNDSAFVCRVSIGAVYN